MFDNAIYIGRKCPFCGQYHEVLVYVDESYIAWENGDLLVQEAFPYLTASEREILISGICPTCWDKVFGSDEEPGPDEVDIHRNIL